MRDKDLYQKILGVESPWYVTDVELELENLSGKVTVKVEVESGVQLHCPHYGKTVPGYDKRRKQWRHLDTSQYQTPLSAEVPRVNCPEHGVSLLQIPWSAPSSGFTALFEALVINWLQACRYLVIDFGTSQSPKSITRSKTHLIAQNKPSCSHKSLGTMDAWPRSAEASNGRPETARPGKNSFCGLSFRYDYI